MTEFKVQDIILSVPPALLTRRIETKLREGSYEADEHRAALMRLRPGMRVLDLGAGLGFISASCARCTGAQNVTAIEANPALLPVLRDNFARNGVEEIKLLHGAVVGKAARKASEVAFDASGAFWAGRVVDTRTDGAISVPSLPLPDLFAAHDPDLVIMDVEGAEQHLFGTRWPRGVRCVVMELHPGQYPDTVIKRIVDCMSASGLTYDPGPSRGRILCFRRVKGR